MNVALVIVVKMGCHDRSKVFINTDEKMCSGFTEKVEEYFKKTVRDEYSTPISDSTLDDCLDSGYYMDGNLRFSVWITWPEVEEIK
jgi:hypothetical protein